MKYSQLFKISEQHSIMTKHIYLYSSSLNFLPFEMVAFALGARNDVKCSLNLK